MLAQGRDYAQLKTRSAVLESDCLDFLFEGHTPATPFENKGDYDVPDN
jgi:hypothetical protein